MQPVPSILRLRPRSASKQANRARLSRQLVYPAWTLRGIARLEFPAYQKQVKALVPFVT